MRNITNVIDQILARLSIHGESPGDQLVRDRLNAIKNEGLYIAPEGQIHLWQLLEALCTEEFGTPAETSLAIDISNIIRNLIPLEKGSTAALDNDETLKTLPRGTEIACFHCKATFPVEEVTNWTDNGHTALCPHCDIDTVLPTNPENLEALHQHYFGPDPMPRVRLVRVGIQDLLDSHNS